ncbi:hypothetical protein POM88_000139 [Heracleum sosnowskyi]|uniref:rRNA N-glycosylase n=1 Tax=Heracleum sosnowskyi TaxID=360622 RepID=A0AAD8N8F4_9APIA|nr:hypothetical protein POM88_000139 [Heracleum sosnowskyi]
MRPKIDEEPWLIFRDDEKNDAVKNFLGKYYMIYHNGKVLEPKFAPFGVSYGSLEKYSRSRSTIPHADVALQDDVLSFGKKQVNKETKELALPITVVIGSVSEATRFKSVLGSLMVGCKGLSNEILWHERNWENLSEFIDEYASGNDPTLTLRRALQMKEQEAQVSSEEEGQMMKNLERKETDYTRLQRSKMRINDF